MSSRHSVQEGQIGRRLRPQRRLATVLLLAFVVVALVPTVVLGVFSSITTARQGRQRAIDQLSDIATSKTQQIAVWYEDTADTLLFDPAIDETLYMDVLDVLTQEPGRSTFEMAELGFLKFALLLSEPEGPFNRLMLANLAGEIVSTTDPTASGWNVTGQPFFEEGRLQTARTAPLRDPLDNELSVYFSAPVNDLQTGILLGVVMGRTSVGALEAVAVDRTALGETGEAFLVTSEGEFVTALRFADGREVADSVGIRRALSGASGVRVYDDYRGETVLGAYRWLREPGIVLVVKQDLAEVQPLSRSLVLANIVVAAGAGVAALLIGLVVTRRITNPISELTESVLRIAEGDLAHQVASDRTDELGSLALAFNEMATRVQGVVGTLEERVAVRTRDLETTAEISRVISSVRDIDELLKQIIELLSERYGYYHVQVFLVDDVGQYAALRASMGKTGDRLLAAGHRLAVGSQSVIGQVTATGQHVVALDTDSSSVHRRNELLPDTRSELALPLSLGEQVLGALDVQSTNVNAFDSATITTLQSVAEQLAIAVNNARLLEQTESRLREQTKLGQLLTRESWDEFLEDTSEPSGYVYDLNEVRPVEHDGSSSESNIGLKVPISLRGETIGELVAEFEDEDVLNEEDRLLVEAVGERVGLALENARLYQQEAERSAELDGRAQRLAALNRVSAQLAATLQMDSILDVAVEGMVAAVGADHGAIVLLNRSGTNFEISVDYPAELSEKATLFEDGNLAWNALLEVREPLLVKEAQTDALLRPVKDVLVQRSTQSLMIVPLLVGGEAVGVVGVEFVSKREGIEPDRIELAQTLANQIAVAIANTRLFEQTEESLQQTASLYQAGRAIVEAESLEEVMDAILTNAAREVVDRIAIVLIEDPEQGFADSGAAIRAEWFRHLESPSKFKPVPIRSDQLPMFVTMGREGLIVGDVEEDTRLDDKSRAVLKSFGDQSGIYIPLPSSTGQVLGWLMLGSVKQHKFSNEDVDFYQLLATQGGTAIDGRHIFERTQQRAIKLAATNTVSQAATSILDIETLLPQIVDLIRDSFGYYHAQIFLVEQATSTAILRASSGDIGIELLARAHGLPVGSQSVIGQVTETGEAIIVRDTNTDSIHQRNELLPNTRSELAIPLKHGKLVIGALDVQSTRPNDYREEDVAILQTLADQLAVALENAQLFQDIQDRVAELTTVNIISQEVSRAQTLEALFDTVSGQMVRAFEAESGFLALYDKTANSVAFPIMLENGERVSAESVEVKPGLISHIIDTGVPIMIVEELETAVQEYGEAPGTINAKSWLGVPLTIGDEVIGLLAIQNVQREHAYDDGNQRMLSTLAAYVAVSVRNAQLFDETERRAAELGFLFDVTSEAVGVSDLDEVLNRIVVAIRDEIGEADATSVALVDQANKRLILRASSGYSSAMMDDVSQIPIGEGLSGWVAAKGDPLLIADVRSDERYIAGAEGIISEMVVPLMAGSVVVGVVNVESRQPDAFSADDLRLLQTLSGTLSAIIQNVRLIDEVTAANEALRELDLLKSQFLANMSHELRTPLNSIIGFSRVILKGIDGPLTELQEQDLETIYSSGQHLLSLINDILDLSKIEAGKMELAREYVDLTAVIEGVISTSMGLVQDKDIEINTDVPPDLPEVYCDEMRVRQVLLNLMSNAAKFTREGSITLKVELLAVEQDEPEMIRVSVTDTGMGISDENMEKLFSRFSQVDASTTRAAGGTGLGLSISLSLIELHGGKMGVESKEGKGSTFYITLPVHEPRPIVTGLDNLTENGDKPVIVAVDDDERVLGLYERFLGNEGYVVVSLTSGIGVVETVQKIQPAAVMLDVMMSDYDGWQVIEDLKQNPGTNHIPVILCTLVEEQERGFKLGAAEYLVKPIVEDDLLAVLKHLDMVGNGGSGEG